MQIAVITKSSCTTKAAIIHTHPVILFADEQKDKSKLILKTHNWGKNKMAGERYQAFVLKTVNLIPQITHQRIEISKIIVVVSVSALCVHFCPWISPFRLKHNPVLKNLFIVIDYKGK